MSEMHVLNDAPEFAYGTASYMKVYDAKETRNVLFFMGSSDKHQLRLCRVRA